MDYGLERRKMKCEYCNKEVEKGYMDCLETANYKFYICDDCMILIEDKLRDLIQTGEKE